MNDSPDHPHPDPRPKPLPPSDPAAGTTEGTDDISTRALSEALRSSFVVVKLIMVALVIVFLGSGFFTVGTQEKAVILRWGKPLGTDESALLGPGPHWALPYPIDEVVKIPLGEVQTVHSTVAWYGTNAAFAASGQQPPPAPSLDPARDGYVLTADANIIHARGTVRYRIREPGLSYEFNFINASNHVLEAFNNALVFAGSRYTVDDILTRDTIGFREAVRNRLDQLIAQRGLSVTVEQADIQAIPPGKLTQAFNAVGEADQRRSKRLSEAQSYANGTISRAKGEAAARINAGENERNLLVEFVKADATNFLALLPAYQRDPDLFMRQRQTETLQRIYTNAELKWALPSGSDGKPTELRLQIDRALERPKPAPAPTPKAEGHHD